MEPEEESFWTRTASNMERPLLHGYYVTRLVQPQELRQNISWEGVRQREREFFDNKEIWSGNPRIHCGTGILTDALSEKLSKMIADRCEILSCLMLIKTVFPIWNKPSRLECAIL